MKNTAMQARLSEEVLDLVHSRRSLMLASTCEDGSPYASYAPFAVGDDCLYILVSDIAVHGLNLVREPRASVLVIEDEEGCGELFARIRVNYRVEAEQIESDSSEWREGVAKLVARHGERPQKLSELADFRLFRLTPKSGRYVKGFGRAYDLVGGTLAGEAVNPKTDGHRPRQAAAANG
jgi:putative heme iron utilization protein